MKTLESLFQYYGELVRKHRAEILRFKRQRLTEEVWEIEGVAVVI